MSIPIAVVEALIDENNGLTDAERLQYLRDAIERQKLINARRWTDTGSGAGYDEDQP